MRVVMGYTVLFQFQPGSIRRNRVERLQEGAGVFQFQPGSIRRLLTSWRGLASLGSFNSSLVLLEGGGGKRTRN